MQMDNLVVAQDFSLVDLDFSRSLCATRAPKKNSALSAGSNTECNEDQREPP